MRSSKALHQTGHATNGFTDLQRRTVCWLFLCGRKIAIQCQSIRTDGRKVSPMQIAAQILEDALADLPDGKHP